MITEIAEIDVIAGHEPAFEAAVASALPLFATAAGCHGMELQRSIEVSARYWLFVQWDDVDSHMVGFRQSKAFAECRSLVGPHFANPPRVEHGETAAPDLFAAAMPSDCAQ